MKGDIFKPECLTVSLGNECNLGCSYCYAESSVKVCKTIPDDEYNSVISQSAQIVAENCINLDIPLYLGFQGGGEPLVHFEELQKIFYKVLDTAKNYNLKLFSYLASNGTLEPEKYLWLAENFSQLCISVDGPEYIHDRHRKFKNGGPVFQKVKKTVKILYDAGKRPVCRVTVTDKNVSDLPESVRYLVSELGFMVINIEPVYSIYKTGSLAPDPDLFADKLLEAQKIASDLGCRMLYTGYRSFEIHGAYCNSNKNVLFITPNGTASICLFHDNEQEKNYFTIGGLSGETGKFGFDYEKIALLQNYINRVPEECLECEIKDHCTRGCPDICHLKMNNSENKISIRESLRCRINRALYLKGFNNADK